MNKVMIRAAALVALSGGVFAACSTGSGVTGSEAPPIKDGTSAKAYPEAVLVDLKQGGEVVAACSGSLIAPKVVLTAGHCVYSFTAWNVSAPNAAGQTATATKGATLDWKVKGENVDPSVHDLGLVFLSSAITLPSYPKLASTALASNAEVLNIGRIDRGTLSDTNLFVSKPIRVSSGASAGFPFDYSAVDDIEPGDSGGPDVLPGPAPHTIVAVNSGAGSGSEVLARVDLVRDWIEQQIASHGGGGASDPGSSGSGTKEPTCGDGSCNGSETCSSCPADCGACASTCAHDPCATGQRLRSACDPCVAQVCAADSYCCAHSWDGACVAEAADACGTCGTPSSDCGSLSYKGRCDGDVAVWCDGSLQALDCGAAGLGCGLDPTGELYDCE